MTRYIGILGFPLKHSLSPIFQQAALDYYGLDMRYEVWEVDGAALAARMARIRREGQFLGANVTIPHKELVLPFLDGLDDTARGIGAVNTIIKEPGRLIGYNTDAPGFLRSLTEVGFDVQGKRAVILGAGGAARAVAWALLKAGVSRLTLFNRTPMRASELALQLTADLAPEQQVAALPLEAVVMAPTLAQAQLVVNATSVGLRHSPVEGQFPLPPALIPQDALIYDLVYNPVETPLIKLAKEKGARTMSGLSMLIHQGALSFEKWTGRPAPVEVMFKAAREALEH